MFKVTLLITGAVASASFFSIIFYSIFTIQTKYAWIPLVVSFFILLLLGFLLVKFVKLGYIALGSCLGYIVGNLIYQIVINNIKYDQQIAYWITIAACIILFAILALYLIKHILIFLLQWWEATWLLKETLLFLVISHIIFEICKKKKFEELKSYLDNYVYIYIGCWILLFILSLFVQYKINSDGKKDARSKFEKIKG